MSQRFRRSFLKVRFLNFLYNVDLTTRKSDSTSALHLNRAPRDVLLKRFTWTASLAFA